MILRRLLHLLCAWWRADTLSAHWLRAQRQEESRIDFQSVNWRWPVQKRLNEAAQFQRHRLRRSA